MPLKTEADHLQHYMKADYFLILPSSEPSCLTIWHPSSRLAYLTLKTLWWLFLIALRLFFLHISFHNLLLLLLLVMGSSLPMLSSLLFFNVILYFLTFLYHLCFLFISSCINLPFFITCAFFSAFFLIILAYLCFLFCFLFI